MRNNLFYSVLMLCSACIFAGCNDGDKEEEKVPVPAVIQGKVYSFDVNAEAERWKGNQIIGVTMVKAGSAEPVQPYYNVKYQTTVYPVGYFTPMSMEDVLTYPQDGSKVDIVAYYPYLEEPEADLYPISVADQAKIKNFNLLYANNSKELSEGNKKTTLELRPVMTEFILRLLPGDGVTKEYLASPSVSVSGMYTKGAFNLLKGIFEETQKEDMQDIVLPLTDSEEAVELRGMLFPHISTQGCTVDIVLPKMGRTFHWAFEGLPELKSGYRYTCNIEIGLDKIEVTTTESAIEDWKDNEEIIDNGTAYAPEFIKNKIEDLPLGDWQSSDKDVLNAEVDTWFFHLDKGKKMTTVIMEDMDKGQPCKVLHGMVGTDYVSPVSQYVAYRMPTIEPVIYTLSFRAKGSAGSLRCYVKTGNSSMFVGTKLNNNQTPYNGYMLLGLKADADYQDFSFDFDCSHTVPSTYSYSEAQRAEATSKDLAKCAVAFGANVKGQEFYIYDVSFKRKLNN